ncbi:MAG TPA: HNH endonuclease signature motif containing protein [Candidatus Dojkabacteria bacterium]|nr:HNH endonuclease signature motif containing protein [Candidatus Dojkabacteria bacterium]
MENKSEALKKLLKVGVEIASLAFVAFGAFSDKVRREIFERDKGTCQRCGRRFKDGWMLQCSHFDHERNEGYDDPENGQLECIRCHMANHLSQMGSWGDEHYRAVVLLAGLVMREGYHTWKWYLENPARAEVQKQEDISDMFELFGRNGYNAWDFIDNDNEQSYVNRRLVLKKY